MGLHPSVAERLARLAPDQRAAATAPPGPSLCIAPAGSGKTTTLVARAAWLIATGTPPGSIWAITFNKRAAVEMTDRLDAAMAPLGVAPGDVRVRTFHALGREILGDAGIATDTLIDRAAILAEVAPWADEAARLRLDTVISQLKVELGVSADDVAADPDAGPMARAFVPYERAVAAIGGLDFDDLILRAIKCLELDPRLLGRWRERCGELLVDEVQDVDRAQLRLALLLAAPANRIFLVGDDDQSIYGWRLADVTNPDAVAPGQPGPAPISQGSAWRSLMGSRPPTERHFDCRFDVLPPNPLRDRRNLRPCPAEPTPNACSGHAATHPEHANRFRDITRDGGAIMRRLGVEAAGRGLSRDAAYWRRGRNGSRWSERRDDRARDRARAPIRL